MAKCRAEDIKDKVMGDLVKDYPTLNTSKIKLLRIEEIAFKIARAQLLGVVKVNTTEQSLSDRLDRLKLDKIDKTSGTIEIDKSNKDKSKGVESKTETEAKIVTGNIWNMDGYKVVSTNLDGIHGAGLAKQAVERGKITKYKNNRVSSSPGNDVITLAVKGREPNTVPVKYKGYKNNAWAEKVVGKNIDLLKEELEALKVLADSSDKMIYLPEAGLGHGEGDPSVIRPLLLEAAKHPMITLILKDETAKEDVESTRGTVRTDRTGYAGVPHNKAKKHTLEIGGLSIPYETVPVGSIASLASTNMATGRVRIQEGLTAIKVAEYLLNKEEVEGASATTKSKTKETRGLVVGALNLKYKINIMGILKGMKDNDQLLRKFLLLHEYRHTLQLKKSGGKDAFKVAYNADPVKYELDADLFALRVLKDEIGLENMTKEDFSLEKAGYTIEKSKSTEPTKSPTEAPKPKQSATDEKIQKIQQALGALVPLSEDVLETMTDEDVDKYIKSESESTKQKDDTMSSNIVDRTTNNIVKEAKECANNGM